MERPGEDFRPLGLAVLTVSDTRTRETDGSGDLLCAAAAEAGHDVVERDLVADDVYRIRAVVSAWIAAPQVHAVVVTGGTGMAARDRTPEALRPLLDMNIEGFGELFRQLSFEEIGASTLQSRAMAGMANRTVIVCLPGSPGACRTAWNRILLSQFDSRHRPCNLAQLVLPG